MMRDSKCRSGQRSPRSYASRSSPPHALNTFPWDCEIILHVNSLPSSNFHQNCCCRAFEQISALVVTYLDHQFRPTMCATHTQAAAESKPDVSSNSQQIRASVLHGAKDLRIVSCVPSNRLRHRLRRTLRNLVPLLPQGLQTFRSASVRLASAVLIFTTTGTTAMATFLSKNLCPWATSPLVLLLVWAQMSRTSV